MLLLMFVFISSHAVTGVVTQYNISSDDDSSGRTTYNTAPYYDYYDSHNPAPDTSSSYYTPVAHHYPSAVYTPVKFHQHYEGSKYYQHSHGNDLCTWGHNFIDHILKIGAAKLGLLGLLKAVITAVGAGLITKIPLLLFKIVAVPIGLIIVGIPLLLPIVLPLLALLKFFPKLVTHYQGHGSEECTENCDANRHTNGNKKIEERLSRAMKAFTESEACVGRLACELGNLNSESEYKRHVFWLLGYMQRSAPENEQAMLTTYKNAYLRGNEGQSCSNGFYRCDMAKIVSSVYGDQET